MNVEEMTFGVEIETTIPRGTLAIGPHGQGYDIPQLPGWKADRDPSIRATGAREACEFVSPVYTGSAGLQQLLRDLATIKGFRAAVNPSCGLHVHVGFDKGDAEQLDKLLSLVANFEKAIYASTGTKDRERGRWCNSLHRYGDAERAKQRAGHERYHVCNIATSKPTVEFRAFGATLDAVKLSSYVRMCVGLVERALSAKKTAEWTGKTPAATSPLARKGEGQTQVNRLFYQLGWTKGRRDHVHGDLKGENVPSIKAAKKELMRLAHKYDNPETAPTSGSRRGGIVVGAYVRFNSPGHRLHDQVGFVTATPPRRAALISFPSGTTGVGRVYRVARRLLVVVPNPNN